VYSNNMLCDRCHEREATCSSTDVIGDVTRSIILCTECFESSAPPEMSEFFAGTARCRYCGGVPCCGGADFVDSLSENQQMSLLCLRCTYEFGRYWQQQLEHVPQDLPQQEQMVVIRALLDEAERHMRQWVSERGSR